MRELCDTDRANINQISSFEGASRAWIPHLDSITACLKWVWVEPDRCRGNGTCVCPLALVCALQRFSLNEEERMRLASEQPTSSSSQGLSLLSS